ncbi:hypothetical protein JI752_000030 [Lysobacter sp. MMG2]|uniref:hypothetical protein n=1 Tax=Lysobacter sp. MMG2 TaxID=2801338 RepID=UPI001C23BABB|nr:hypothetical protein [Lysobacter sp. MMG2]MBU8974517.1 hypothetical protein [Lysobacter sp. MMG2]
MSSPSDTLFRWYQLTERERLVWASAFSQFVGAPLDAARAADAKVVAVKGLDIDQYTMSPEHELAKSNLEVPFEAFAPWYRVAYRISHRLGCQPLTDEDVARAYDAYQRSRCDFY